MTYKQDFKKLVSKFTRSDSLYITSAGTPNARNIMAYLQWAEHSYEQDAQLLSEAHKLTTIHT